MSGQGFLPLIGLKVLIIKLARYMFLKIAQFSSHFCSSNLLYAILKTYVTRFSKTSDFHVPKALFCSNINAVLLIVDELQC